ncbi:Na+/H+ antiporter subunit E [Micromonospora sp. BRA006-A]|nr:Na+/H+ antiporter subunit E [Micromonospora sp. BRA006-A]
MTGLVTVWVLLWGTFSWANVISGLVVAAVLLVVFPLPLSRSPAGSGRYRCCGS